MKQYDWAVIGAGPAGIAAVGKLLDAGIKPKRLLWVDPTFTVGDFGTRWRNVSSNTRVELFIRFFNECRSFNSILLDDLPIYQINPQETCALHLAAEPLQRITNHLRQQVSCYHGVIRSLNLYNRQWEMDCIDAKMAAKNVILALGSEPHSLSYRGVEEIPLTTALDPQKLSAACSYHDRIAVFGASHSAMIILKTLIEIVKPKAIINFYREPLKFAVNFGDFILFDDTGLKGTTAEWAKATINGQLPSCLKRVLSTDAAINANLVLCNKVIYATGFRRRSININGMLELTYNNRSGIIAPGLFGFGIAFPEAKSDRFGTVELRVGLWKFMEYINTVLPIWLRYET